MLIPVEPEFGPRFELAEYAGRSLRDSFDSTVANFFTLLLAAEAPRPEFLDPDLELTRDAVRDCDEDGGFAGELLFFRVRGRGFPEDDDTTWLLELTSKVAEDDSIVV